jgi:hypothetical protein
LTGALGWVSPELCSVYGASEQVGGTQGLIVADPTEFTADALLEDSVYGELDTSRGSIEFNKGAYYWKFGFGIMGEGIGKGISGGTIYSTTFSNIPDELKKKNVQKELFFLLMMP